MKENVSRADYLDAIIIVFCKKRWRCYPSAQCHILVISHLFQIINIQSVHSLKNTFVDALKIFCL